MIFRLPVALRYLLVALVIPAAMNLVGCRTPMFRGNKEMSAGVPAKISTRGAAEQALAEALWTYHEVAITDTLEGIAAGEYRYYDSGSKDFERAVDFFEFTTGILSETGTHFGRRITPDLGEALDRWRQWHREHRGRLHFDQENCDLGGSPHVNVGLQGDGQAIRFTAEPVDRIAAEKALVEALWSYHQAAIEEVLDGVASGRYRNYGAGDQKFEKALDFFDFVTGIDSNTAYTFGRAITPGLSDVLTLWQQWYKRNRENLYFDLDHCEVTLSKPVSP